MTTGEPIMQDSDDIRPTIGADSGNRPLWIGLGIILGLGLLLFALLEGRRQSLAVPTVKARADDLALATPNQPPPLFIPPEPASPPEPPISIKDRGPVQSVVPHPVVPATSVPLPTRPNDVSLAFAPPPPPMPKVDASPVLVLDSTAAEPDSTSAKTDAPAVASRARASRLRNRATVVPQGTLIAAVLETALDSTQPGQVRALVSSDVVNLRGDKVLIPRGSRLFGDYKGDIAAGQKRAFVQWTRLVRPDGVTIAIDSPAADQLGRAGIKGRVNTHFFERLGGALLQSTIDVGTIIASREIYNGGGSSVLIAVPNGMQGATSQIMGPAPKPTLKVRQGTRISVFVMRDLDFTSVEGGR